MKNEQRKLEDRRGLRFPFSASAEIIPQGSRQGSPAHVSELSFRGCFLETCSAMKEHQRMHLKIFFQDQFFETPAEVLYVRPNGLGLVFGETNPHFRHVIQDWILTAMDAHPTPEEV